MAETMTTQPQEQPTVAPKKTVYLIRHAESEENQKYNAARRTRAAFLGGSLPSFSDCGATVALPFQMFRSSVLDAGVSDDGRYQIEKLREFIVKEGLLEEEDLVVAHSPLNRARQTANGAVKGVDYIDEGNNWLENLLPHNEPLVNEPQQDDETSSPEMIQLDCLKEINPREMARHGNKALHKRVDEFEEWIESRPEQYIVVVGHSVYFQKMLKLPKPFGNCDVWKITYGGEPGGSIQDLPRAWNGLTRLYHHEENAVGATVGLL